MVDLFVPGRDWNFWDVASPLQAAVELAEIRGADAASEAMECVAAARADGREDDCRFWIAVYARLCAFDRQRLDAV